MRQVPLLPPPADLARCRFACGRLVWHFDTRCCAICDYKARPGRRAVGAHPEESIEAMARADFEEQWERMQRAKAA